jgi:aminopeptidase N
VWAERSNEIASRIVGGLFPADQDLRAAISPDKDPVVLQAGEWLSEHGDAPQALRRILVEQRDHLLRALAAQARSRQP